MFNFKCFTFTLLITKADGLVPKYFGSMEIEIMQMVTTSFAINGSLPVRNDENTMYPRVKGHFNKVNADSSQIGKHQDDWRKSSPSSTAVTTEKVQKEQIDELSDGINSIFENEEDEVIPSREISDDTKKYNQIENRIMKETKNYPEGFQKDLNYLPINKKSKNQWVGDGVSTVPPEDGKYKDKLIRERMSIFTPKDKNYKDKFIDEGVSTMSTVNWKFKAESTEEGMSTISASDRKYKDELIDEGASVIPPVDKKIKDQFINDGISTILPSEEIFRSESSREEILSVDGKFINESIDNGVIPGILNKTEVSSTESTPAAQLKFQQFIDVKRQKKDPTIASTSPNKNNLTFSSKIFFLSEKFKKVVSALTTPYYRTPDSLINLHLTSLSRATTSSSLVDKLSSKSTKENQKYYSISRESKLTSPKFPSSSEQTLPLEISVENMSSPSKPVTENYNLKTSNYSDSINILKSEEISTTNLSLPLEYQNETNLSEPNTTIGPDTDMDPTVGPINTNDISDPDLEPTQNLTLTSTPLIEMSTPLLSFTNKGSNSTTTQNMEINYINSTTNLSLPLEYQNETNLSEPNTTIGPDTDTDLTVGPINTNDTSDPDLEPPQNLTLTSTPLIEMSTPLLSFTNKGSNSTTTQNIEINYINSTSNLSMSVDNVTKGQRHSNFSKSSTKGTIYFSRSWFKIPQTLSTSISSSNFTFFSPKLSSINSKKRVPSERRVETPEKEQIDIYWICPPEDEHLINRDIEYEWYKVQPETGNYSHPLSNMKDVTTGKFTLQIKGVSNNHGGRYLCVSRDSSPFATPKMYFYQIVVLNSKWINIGSTSTAILYFNQKAIINCPYGDIIKNKVPINEGCCSSRISIMEISVSSIVDLYQCSDSNKTTVKFPSISSSTNCSLTLNGCASQSTTKCNASVSCPRASETNEVDRCQFKHNNYQNILKLPKRCPGSIYIRFYYNIAKEKCFPFETDICGDDYYTFSNLAECDETCSKISSSIEKCFYPRNQDESHLCAAKNLTGKYLAYFDIEMGDCKWFYHCRQFKLTSNVFESISMCNLNCLHNKKLIHIESFKACRYENFTDSSAFLWSFNKQTGNCENNTSIGMKRLKFSSRNNCEKVCKIYDSKEICDSRPENGQCQPSRMKWYFHMPSNRCVKILDGGCGDSLNRFISKSSCERICMKFIDQQLPGLSIPSTRVPTTSTYHSSTSTKFQRITTLKVKENTSQKNQNIYPNMKSVDISQLRIEFNASDRELDFEPCNKESISNTCEFGLNRQKFITYRYTFHRNTATCDQTIFSGCGSRENLFDDSNDCKAACEYRWHASLKFPDCQSPFDVNCMVPATVEKAVPLRRYFYQSTTKECVPFTSVNNSKCLNQYFTSKERCLHICKPDPPTELLLQNRCFGKVVLSKLSCAEDQKVNRWFYMQSIDQCLEYRTCPVNYPGNTFSMKEECDNSCRASNILTVCGLPMDPGVGNRMKSKYFYNRLRGKCQLFLYRGSLGNLNRFDTKIECQKFCIVTMENTKEFKMSSLVADDYHYKEFKGTRSSKMWLKENIDREYCYDPHKYGECNDYQQEVFIQKYSYDSYSKRCEPYIFSGCGSISRNSFDSIAICDKMCTERITKTVSSYCSRLDTKCSDSPWVYWAYSSERGGCEQFKACNKVSSYQFKFKNESHCSQFCSPVLPMKKDLFDICHLPPMVSKNCTKQSERWFHNPLTGSCYSTYSCKQYGNNFPSLTSCRAFCEPNSLKDICQLPADKGPCDDNDTLSYYFDWTSQTCKLFAYGGCLGNRNRFRTRLECQSVCPSESQCNIKLNDPTKCDPHNLNPVSNIYRYDTGLGKCRHVDNFTCGDHTKYFETVDQCTEYCVVPMEYQFLSFKDTEDSPEWKQPICTEPLRFNTYPVCTKNDAWLPRFYYSQEQGRCLFFYYNGCDGVEDRGNRFTTVFKCTTKCLEHSTTTGKTFTHRQISEAPYVTSPFPIRTSQNPSNDLALGGPVKPGLCPDSNYQCSQVQENSIKCRSDADCQYSWKCCPCEMSLSILSRCIEPLNCMTSKYGCCADGVTFASDDLHLNCKKVRPTIANLPEIIDDYSENELLLNCQVSGDPKPSINWIYLEKNSLALNPRSVDLDLVQPFWSGQIKISEFNNFLGLWMCRVNNELGIDEKEVFISRSKLKLPFLQEYSFTSTDKLSINVTVDHRVTLHCPIYGIPRPTVTWFLNKIMINESLWSLTIFGRHLIIENAKHLHSGIWNCVANNKYGTVSHKIRLQILEAIQIFPPPMGTTIKASPGHQVILFCNVQVEGYRSISWYWETGVNRTMLNSTLEFESRILKVSEFRNQYNGSYVCEADNKVSRAILKYKIVPYSMDEISLNPSGTLFIGTTVTLKCPLKISRGADSVIWKKDGILLGVKSIKLKLDLKSKSDSGFYSCQQNDRNYMTYLYLFDLPPNR